MEILRKSNIIVGLPPEGHEDAILRTGKMLVENGYATERYVEGMLARDRSFSTAIGNFIAIPHGEKDYKDAILETGIVVLTYPEGIIWGEKMVKLVVGIAARGDEHLSILSRIVEAMEDEESVEKLVAGGDADAIYTLLTEGDLGE
jgi:mannitol/fructose-specific phosphotransferase system IIA component